MRCKILLWNTEGNKQALEVLLEEARYAFSRCKSRGLTKRQSRHTALGAANTTLCSNSRAGQRYTSASGLKPDSGTLKRRRTGAGCGFPRWILAREAVAWNCGLSTILQAARKCRVPSPAGRSRITKWQSTTPPVGQVRAIRQKIRGPATAELPLGSRHPDAERSSHTSSTRAAARSYINH